MAALGEVGTRLIIADMVQNMIVKAPVPKKPSKVHTNAMVEVFKVRGAPV